MRSRFSSWAGGYVQAPEPLKQLAKGGRVALVGQRRQEGIAGAAALVFEAVEVAVLLDVLLEDVYQLEIEREGPGRGDCLGQIHLPDQLHDRGGGILLAGVAQVLEPQQALRLTGGTLAVEHGFPEVFHQLQTLAQ